MAWTERSEVKVDGLVGHGRGLDFLGGEWKGNGFWEIVYPFIQVKQGAPWVVLLKFS